MEETILVLSMAVFISLALAGKSLAPFVPARRKDLPRILKLANLKSGEIFYDLGCGIGAVAIGAGQIPGVVSVGVEIAWPLYIICRLRRLFHKNKNITFVLKNLYKTDLSNADVVYVFGLPATLKLKLKEKLQRELKPGARIISYAFKIDGLNPEIVDKPTPKDLTIYLYKI